MVVPPSTGGNGSTHFAPTRPPPRLHSNNIPYSARKAPALDMSTVERRGSPLASREPAKRVRPHGLQEAPTFRPTEEEFKDPMEYMRKIAPEGSKYGICRIIPPDGWDPNFAIDTERFHFRTRRQELNSVEGGITVLLRHDVSEEPSDKVSGTRANLNYLDQLAKFHKQHGNNLNRFPSVDKRPLDLYKLKKAVEVRGGFEKVCKLKKWAEIGRDLGYSGKIMSSLSTSLKNSYQRWLHPYEEYLRIAKPGVQQQLEFEYGGPIHTPSPLHSPLKRTHSQQNTPTYQLEPSPAIRATNALQASIHQSDATPERSLPPSVEAPRPMPSSGFTAVNSSGFAPINASPSGFVAVNNLPPPPVKRESINGINHGPSESPAMSATNTPEYRPHASNPTPAANMTNGTNGHVPNHLKRTISHDSLNGGDGTETGANGDTDGSGRRSKRLKKDSVVPTVAGSHMSLLRPSTPRMRARSGTRKPGEKCEQCGKTDDRASIIACDSCDMGYHKYCLDPPLVNIPDYDWHCPKCLVGTGEYGFEEGGIYSLKQFQEKANNFKDNYFSSKQPFDPVLNTKRPVTEDDTEREFWKLVESLTETVEVEYGADIHSTTHGSGFPTVETHPLDPYSKNSWNLNVLPLHQESLFRHIKSDISGMTVPWLYVGMCFSTFCWHNEDHYTYSANYQHFGATKTWYGIPGADADAFEEAMRQAVPELFETQPDLLFQLVTLLPPDQLKKAGVNVYALDQRAGQFVVTFPQAYHAGFNHGFNFNEAVNFAPADWERFGESGVERLKDFRRQPCFSHDELLLTAAGRDTTIKTAKWLAPALERMRDRELKERKDLVKEHKDIKVHNCKIEPEEIEIDAPCELGFEIDDQDLPEEDYQCSFCKAFTFLSQFRCHVSGKVVCLLHVSSHDCCEEPEEQRLISSVHTVRYRLSDHALNALVQKVVDRAAIPEAWTARLDKALEDDAKPSLKTLHAILTEGEKIVYDLPGLEDLSRYVSRCNKWVEEANNYITRKQQNRRKNEKAWRKGSTKSQWDDKDRELRRVEKIKQLLADAEELSFDCPQITTLRERANDIEEFQRKAIVFLANPAARTLETLVELIEEAKTFNVDMPQLTSLEEERDRMEWKTDATAKRGASGLTLDQCDTLIQRASAIGIESYDVDLIHFQSLKREGEIWDKKANELVDAETVNYQQLDALATQAQKIPVKAATLQRVENILRKQKEAQREIMSLIDRSRDPDFRKRPRYKEVREIIEGLTNLNSKPTGTIDLEREQKRHEDWMRKGKKLFGKANAPLHILYQHMKYVEGHNKHCFDLSDKPRNPVEPPSRGATPEDDEERDDNLAGRDVFCICRQPEAGMMIECELCHEWYHGKCLKIARGKVKDVDNYTCPICDWRVKIPRDAARPKLEDLQDWAAEMEGLPFQPDEEDVLESLITQAQDFRDILKPYLNPLTATSSEIPTQIFWLRKIEGAEILLAFETNFFRQELHRMNPVAPNAPPILQESLSTRKPRPTKQQKLMAQHGVERPEDLPQHLRTKAHVFKRKSEDQTNKQPATIQPRSASSEHTPPSALHEPSRNNPILVQMQSDFPRYHGETEMTWGGNPPQSGARSDPPIFAPTFSTAPLEASPFSPTTRPPMDPGLFSTSDPAEDVTPMFEGSSQTNPPPDEELFAGVNLDGEGDGDGADGEGLGLTSHAMDALEAMNSASNSAGNEGSASGTPDPDGFA